ncbi:taurine transporter substrate binding subunit [Methylomusa anaerophila]|uniref:Taurine transporter substrate binding subunit n=2 Tax=Methylomusa anaerophila TaxID=1930071 RepID=A0A348ALF2_9FIRM|nr:taurine transporter substrate binding subunit [Methylomusa anaerophila]
MSLAAVIMFMLLAAAGCGKSSVTKDAAGEADKPKFVNGKLTKEFHLKVATFQSYNEFTIADKLGFFKEVGIIPEYTGVINTPALAVQAVIKGNNHLLALGHPMDIAAARLAGAKIKIVLHSMVDDPDPDKMHITWLTKSDSPINSPQDIVGKKIALNGTSGCAGLIFDEFLRQNNIPKDKLTIVVMPDKQQEQALKQGQIDVAALHNVYTKATRNTGGVKVLTTSYKINEVNGGGPLGGLAVRSFSEDFIKEYPDVVKAYIAADLKAQHWIMNHYDESLKIMADFLQVDVKDVAGNVYPNQWWIQDNDINYWIKLGEQNGWYKPGEVSPKDLYTNDLNPYYTKEIPIPAN